MRRRVLRKQRPLRLEPQCHSDPVRLAASRTQPPVQHRVRQLQVEAALACPVSNALTFEEEATASVLQCIDRNLINVE